MSKPLFSRKRKGKRVDPYPLNQKGRGKSSQTKGTRGRPRKAQPFPTPMFKVWAGSDWPEEEVRGLLDDDPRVRRYALLKGEEGWEAKVIVSGSKSDIEAFMDEFDLNEGDRISPDVSPIPKETWKTIMTEEGVEEGRGYLKFDEASGGYVADLYTRTGESHLPVSLKLPSEFRERLKKDGGLDPGESRITSDEEGRLIAHLETWETGAELDLYLEEE